MVPEPNHTVPVFEVVPSTSPPGDGIVGTAAWLRRMARISSEDGARPKPTPTPKPAPDAKKTDSP
jgi:hypothetical protein